MAANNTWNPRRYHLNPNNARADAGAPTDHGNPQNQEELSQCENLLYLGGIVYHDANCMVDVVRGIRRSSLRNCEKSEQDMGSRKYQQGNKSVVV